MTTVDIPIQARLTYSGYTFHLPSQHTLVFIPISFRSFAFVSLTTTTLICSILYVHQLSRTHYLLTVKLYTNIEVAIKPLADWEYRFPLTTYVDFRSFRRSQVNERKFILHISTSNISQFHAPLDSLDYDRCIVLVQLERF